MYDYDNYRKLKKGERLKTHVEISFLQDLNVHSFDLGTGSHNLFIAKSYSNWEVDVICQEEEFALIRDDYALSVILFSDIIVREDDIEKIRTDSPVYGLTYVLDHKKRSITCLKCGKKSSYVMDYDERYCHHCGFHNDIENQKKMHNIHDKLD